MPGSTIGSRQRNFGSTLLTDQHQAEISSLAARETKIMSGERGNRKRMNGNPTTLGEDLLLFLRRFIHGNGIERGESFRQLLLTIVRVSIFLFLLTREVGSHYVSPPSTSSLVSSPYRTATRFSSEWFCPRIVVPTLNYYNAQYGKQNSEVTCTNPSTTTKRNFGLTFSGAAVATPTNTVQIPLPGFEFDQKMNPQKQISFDGSTKMILVPTDFSLIFVSDAVLHFLGAFVYFLFLLPKGALPYILLALSYCLAVSFGLNTLKDLVEKEKAAVNTREEPEPMNPIVFFPTLLNRSKCLFNWIALAGAISIRNHSIFTQSVFGPSGPGGWFRVGKSVKEEKDL